MTPYKRKEVIGDCTLYLGNCLEILPTLEKVDAVITDPPYGFLSGASGKGAGKLNGRKLNISDNSWDIRPSDALIESVIAMGVNAIIWGGNYFTLPPCRGLLIWDKKQPWQNFSAAEIAWTTFDRPTAMFRLSSSLADKGINNLHPTVKPLELIDWCIDKLPKDADSILDPFMGSGTTGVACANLGRKFIGIEIEPKYFDIACERITNAYRQQKLF